MGALVLLAHVVVLLLPTKSGLIFSVSVDKHRRLASLGSPKLVLVGGSNVALGVDSELLERLAAVPVVNLGLNGGLGLRFMCEEVWPSLGGGDVVMLSPEYEHWRGTLLDGDLNLLWALRARPAGLRQLTSARQAAVLVRNTPEFMQGKVMEFISARPDPVYNRWSFTARGDFAGHLAQGPKRPMLGLARMRREPLNPEAGRIVAVLVQRAAARGAAVVYSFPPLARSAYRLSDNQAAVEDVHERVREVRGLLVAGTPAGQVYADELFFDSVYHLGQEGRQQRTRRMAAELDLIRRRTADLARAGSGQASAAAALSREP